MDSRIRCGFEKSTNIERKKMKLKIKVQYIDTKYVVTMSNWKEMAKILEFFVI